MDLWQASVYTLSLTPESLASLLVGILCFVMFCSHFKEYRRLGLHALGMKEHYQFELSNINTKATFWYLSR